MQFTLYNKAIVATVAAILGILGLVFKTDLGAYADLATGVLFAATPVLVYLIPNFSKVADGGDYEGYVKAETAVAETVGELVAKRSNQVPAPL